MKGQLCAGLVAVFLLEVLGSVRAANTPKYFAVGGCLSLTPLEASSGRIASITWKINGDLLAEWVDKKLDLEFYRTFKGRSSLDTTTGRLEVNVMSKNDSGVYLVEINGIIQSRGYDVKVIRNLTTPEVQVGPLICGTGSATRDCVLTCKQPESITDAELVTYRWTRDEHLIPGSTGENLNISNDEETQRVKTYSCLMKNPVSEEKESRALKNPFFKDPESFPSLGEITGIVIGLIVIGLVAVFVVLIVLKREPFIGWFRKFTGQNTHTSAGSSKQEMADEIKPINPTKENVNENENTMGVSAEDETPDKSAVNFNMASGPKDPPNDISESKTPENPADVEPKSTENNHPTQPSAEPKTAED